MWKLQQGMNAMASHWCYKTSSHFEWMLLSVKLCTLVDKALHGMAPLYLSELWFPDNRCGRLYTLRSAADDKLMVPRHIKCSRSMKCAFCIVDHAACNNLPSDIRNKQSLENFKHTLKTYYFVFFLILFNYLTAAQASSLHICVSWLLICRTII